MHLGGAAAPLVLLADGPTMLSRPDALCDALARGGRHVVRYDLRDAGLGGMVAQITALDPPGAFSAVTLVGMPPVAPSPVDDDLTDQDAAAMQRLFALPMPDWSDRAAAAKFAAARASLLACWFRSAMNPRRGRSPTSRIRRAGGDVTRPTTKPFRFGAVCPLRGDLAAWRDQVRRIADSGYSTLLMPDVPGWQPAPGPTLALASSLAPMRIGTWVYASPVRPAWITAWEAHSLSVLTEGRFEMGIGLGRPGIEDQLRELGMPVITPGERLAQVRDTVAALRQLDGPDLHTPVVLAVRGPKSQALAAEIADTVTFAGMPNEPGVEFARLARDFRARRDVELALHVPVVGNTVAPFMCPPDTDPAALRVANSLAILPDDPAAATEELQRRREEIGYSYFVFGANSADTLAPVVAALAGH